MSQLPIVKIVMNWVARKPATRLYPFEKREAFKNTRGHIGIDIETCTFCTLCAKRCPTAAIVVDRTGKTWTIDRMRCIQCGACVDACAKKCLSMENAYTAPATGKSTETFKPSPKAPAETTPAS